MSEQDVLTCRTFDERGKSVCDAPARYIVWGHLFEKVDKGPKCAKHLPEMSMPPWMRLQAAIYEIPNVAPRRPKTAANRDIGGLAESLRRLVELVEDFAEDDSPLLSAVQDARMRLDREPTPERADLKLDVHS